MKIDYTMMYSCGWEQYDATLKSAQAASRQHIKNPSSKNKTHEIYIDRNKDNEIDENFTSVIIKN